MERLDVINSLRKLEEKIPVFAARVKPLYVLLDWRLSGSPRIPDEDTIAELLRSHVGSLIVWIGKGDFDADFEGFIASGGLKVGFYTEEDFVVSYMRFELEESVVGLE